MRAAHDAEKAPRGSDSDPGSQLGCFFDMKGCSSVAGNREG